MDFQTSVQNYKVLGKSKSNNVQCHKSHEPSLIFNQRSRHKIHEPNRYEDQNWKKECTKIRSLQDQWVIDIRDIVQRHKLQECQQRPVQAQKIVCNERANGGMRFEFRIFGNEPAAMKLKLYKSLSGFAVTKGISLLDDFQCCL